MAKISRRMAIDSVHKVLRAYQKKIEDGTNYTEYLPYAGRQIVKRYKDNEDNYKSLLDAAAQTEEFFTGIDDETLLSYVNVCHELNKIFDLKVSESRKIKGFREETYYFEAGILYLDDEGIDELTELSRTISSLYHLRAHGKGVKRSTFNTIKDADVIENKNEGTINLSINSWKVYLSEKNEITKVEYGTDKTKAQIITSDGTIGAVIEMVGADYEGKGFAKKLLTAAKLETTEDADLELQNKMLDDGLFYINKEEGWIEKQKYFKRMTPPDFLTIQDYKDVTVKAVYDDSKGELTFTYTAGGKTENLFVIKASNNQKEREYPTKSGKNIDEVRADISNPVPYIPEKFPKGNSWHITAFEKQTEKNSKGERINSEYGPYKIRTDAWRYVEAWDYVFDEDLDTKIWKKRLDENGNVIKAQDSGLLIHGGGWSKSSLDNQKGSNEYTDTTLGCIRISNLDVLLIVKVLQEYLNDKGSISLEVK